MSMQAISNTAVATPYVSSGMGDAAGSIAVESAMSSAMPEAVAQGQADVVDIRQAGGGGQGAQETTDAGNQRRSLSGKSPGPDSEKSVVITYNQLARESVVKFLDEEGHIVSQTPPQMYLKTMESSSSKVDEQSGKLLNEVA